MIDRIFRRLIKTILTEGSKVETRNGTCQRLIKPVPFTFTETPLVSLRKTSWKLALREWEWFMSGSSNLADLHPSVHAWWKNWADPSGRVRYNYGEQLRSAGGRVDQIERAIALIKTDPFSRRNVLTTWNPVDMSQEDCPITNCHGTAIQFFVEPNGTIHLNMQQRSVDVLVGLPHNWIQYWAFLTWVAHRTGLKVGSFTWTGGDQHIYEAHWNTAHQMKNLDLPGYSTPKLLYSPTSDKFKADDFSLDSEYTPVIQTYLPLII